jgi:hypothetical protein
MTGSGHPATRPTAELPLERICMLVIHTIWACNLLVNVEMRGMENVQKSSFPMLCDGSLDQAVISYAK